MARFTNGVVGYSRRIKTGDFEWKEASSSISFSTDEDDASQALFDLQRLAAGENYALVEGALGILPKRLAKPDSESPAPSVNQPGANLVTVPMRHATEEELAAQRLSWVLGEAAMGSDADEAAYRAAYERGDQAEMACLDAEGEKRRRRALAWAPTPPATEPVKRTRRTKAAAEDPMLTGSSTPVLASDDLMAEDLATGVPPEITDEDLAKAVNVKNAEIKNSPAIRKLIGKFAPNLSSIAQGARKSFLDNLSRLTAASE